MVVQHAAGRGPTAARAAAKRSGREVHPQGLFLVQHPVDRLVPDFYRYAFLPASREG